MNLLSPNDNSIRKILKLIVIFSFLLYPATSKSEYNIYVAPPRIDVFNIAKKYGIVYPYPYVFINLHELILSAVHGAIP